MNKFKRILIIVVLVFFAAVLLATIPSATYAQKTKTIGLAMHFLQDDWSLSMKRAVEETAQKYGYKVIMTDANFDPARQLEQVESLILRRVDALIVIALNTEEILPVLDKAMKRGITVVGVGLPTDIFYEKRYISNVWTDNTMMGIVSGRQMAEVLLKKGKKDAEIAIIDATFNMYALTLRVAAFKFMTVDMFPGMKIVATERAGTIEEAMKITENLFTAYPGLDGIYATYSSALIGAARAKQARNKMDIVLTGVDADKEICKFVKLGIIDGSGVNNSYPFGVRCVEVAHENLAKGTIFDVPYYVPAPLLDRYSVDKIYEELYGEPLSAYMGK
ncbi:MAG: sugar ABC transporter substrate-binding protein [Thermodesulfovibrionales bacterium]